MTRISVVIVDDEALVRQGLRKLLELSPKIEVLAECSDGEEALKVILREQPDVTLLDVRMPKKNGLEVLRALAEQQRRPAALLLTRFDDSDVLIQAIPAGARGFLLEAPCFCRASPSIFAITSSAAHIPSSRASVPTP